MWAAFRCPQGYRDDVARSLQSTNRPDRFQWVDLAADDARGAAGREKFNAILIRFGEDQVCDHRFAAIAENFDGTGIDQDMQSDCPLFVRFQGARVSAGECRMKAGVS